MEIGAFKMNNFQINIWISYVRVMQIWIEI